MLKKIGFGFFCLCVCLVALAEKKPAAVIKLEPYMSQALQVHAVINGQEGVFLFDTGAGVTGITPDFAKKIGCEPWGRITGFRMNGERMDTPECSGLDVALGEQHGKVEQALVLDLAAMMPKDWPHLDGMIALDAFAGKTITFSLAKREIVVESAKSLVLREREATAVPVRLVRDANGASLGVAMGIPVKQGKIWMEIDSGNTSGKILLGKHLAEQFALDAKKREAQAATVKVTDGVVVQSPALVRDLIFDGNLGTTFLKDWDVTLDLSGNGRAWLTAASKS